MWPFGKKKSGDTAKDRLRLTLIYDKADANGEMLTEMKNDILKVIGKYTEVIQSEVDIHVEMIDDNGRKVPALYANIPIENLRGIKRVE